MAALPSEVIEVVLRSAYEFDWDEVDIGRELARRALLRDAALVCRAWYGAATPVLRDTLVCCRLGDFDAIYDAVASGGLRLDGVRTVVLDESACRDADGEAAAWAQVEDDYGGPVDRTSFAMIDAAANRSRNCEQHVLGDFASDACGLLARLPRLTQLRSTQGRTFVRHVADWSVARLAIESLCDEDDDWRNDWPDEELWPALDKWTALQALSISCAYADPGLAPLPAALCGRLQSLRLGASDGRRDAWNRKQHGVQLQHPLFAAPTPHLRQLDIRLCESHGDRFDAFWPAVILGSNGVAESEPPIVRLTVGWPAPEVRVEDAGAMIRRLPTITVELAIAIGQPEPTRHQHRFAGFDLLDTLNAALQDRRNAGSLVRLEIDVTGFNLDATVWRAHRSWTALGAACQERGVELVLTASG